MNQKYVLITGASRGIGRACALAFARNHYHVFLNCRHSLDALQEVEQEILAAQGTCTLLPGNVGDPDEVREMFSVIESRCPGLDVLVNNAGISFVGLLQDMSDAQWSEILNTNLSSVFYCCRSAIGHMVSQKSGKIINISSMWGTVGASCEAAYSATKSGMNGLTKALAKELAPSNVQVNAIACGAIDTDMNAFLSEDERASLIEEIPAGRLGTPAEVGSLVQSLCSDSGYLTGQVIQLDGGWI